VRAALRRLAGTGFRGLALGLAGFFAARLAGWARRAGARCFFAAGFVFAFGFFLAGAFFAVLRLAGAAGASMPRS